MKRDGKDVQDRSIINTHKFTLYRNEREKGGETHMIRPHSIDLLNLIAECQRFVYDQLDEVVRCGFACEEFELEVNGSDPGSDDP